MVIELGSEGFSVHTTLNKTEFAWFFEAAVSIVRRTTE